MEIVYDNSYTRENKTVNKAEFIEKQSPLDLFKNFYELQNNKELDEEQEKIVKDIFEKLEANV